MNDLRNMTKEEKTIPEEYMFVEEFSDKETFCGTRNISPIGKRLAEENLETMSCPHCGQVSLMVKGVDSEFVVECETCGWKTPFCYSTTAKESVDEFKLWLEAFLLLGSPKERVNDNLTALFYPEHWQKNAI